MQGQNSRFTASDEPFSSPLVAPDSPSDGSLSGIVRARQNQRGVPVKVRRSLADISLADMMKEGVHASEIAIHSR